MEEGSLYYQIRKKKTLSEEEASRKLRDVVDAINHMHGKNIAHRDLKP